MQPFDCDFQAFLLNIAIYIAIQVASGLIYALAGIVKDATSFVRAPVCPSKSKSLKLKSQSTVNSSSQILGWRAKDISIIMGSATWQNSDQTAKIFSSDTTRIWCQTVLRSF